MAVATARLHRRAALTEVERAAVGVIVAGAVLIPMFVKRNLVDTFRLPKELAFRGEAILLLAIAGLWALTRRRRWRIEWRRADYAVAALVAVWSGITVLTSTNRALSIDSYATILAAVVIYLATTIVAQGAGVAVVDCVMIAAAINAVVAILQETGVWNPFRFPSDITGHLHTAALIGNPNDVGTFFVAPLIAALVMAASARGARRWIYAGLVLLMIGGLLASATRTAIAAFIVAATVFALLRSWRAIFAVLGVVIIVAAVAASPSTSLGKSVRTFWSGVKDRRYDIILSERLPLFLSAMDMLRDHPLLGVGPGCYAYLDVPYRTQLSTHYPDAWTKGWRQKAGQAHNDHLQVAAETGMPGYALLLAALGIAAIAPFGPRRPAPDDSLERHFAALLLPPLAAGAFVVMLAQFPLELAAPRLMFLTFGGLALTWIRRDERR